MLSNVKTTQITTLSQQLQSILSKNPREIRHFLPVEFLQQPTVLHTVPIWENQDYDFFALWLDPSLSCNAGFFKDDSHSLLFSVTKNKSYENFTLSITLFSQQHPYYRLSMGKLYARKYEIWI